MRRIITFLAAAVFAIASFGQNFEGKIVYANSYKSKIPGVTDEQFTSMMGSTQEYYIKDGDYRSISNGSFLQWQLYVNNNNKLYSKMANSETLFWNDGATKPDSILKTEINKAAAEILGYKCDELILTFKNGVQKYYFTSKFPADPSLFENHKYGNWYDFLSRSNALPLKYTFDNSQFFLESVATEVDAMKLEKAFFELPTGSKTMKSPY